LATLPTGVVTFLFSDLEGSTRVPEEHGTAAATHALTRHHEIYADLLARNQDVIFETVGDAVCAAFAQPPAALQAALDAHRALKAEERPGPGPRPSCSVILRVLALVRQATRDWSSLPRADTLTNPRVEGR
jgi:class 3 adenylate cyclase